MESCRLDPRLDSCDRRAGRKGDWVGRASDCLAVLKMCVPGWWDVLRPKQLVNRFRCVRMGRHQHPHCAQSVAGRGPGEARPCSECSGESKGVQTGLSSLCFCSQFSCRSRQFLWLHHPDPFLTSLGSNSSIISKYLSEERVGLIIGIPCH